MKIDKSHSSELSLISHAWIFRLIGLVLLGVCGIILFFMTQHYSLSCQRTNDNSGKHQCVLTTISILNSKTIKLNDVSRAYVHKKKAKKKNSNYYLKLKAKPKPMKINNFGIVSASKIKLAANEINYRLRHNDSFTLTINTLQPLWFFALPGGFFLIGIIFILLPKKITITFNTLDNTIVIIRKNFFGREKILLELNDLKKVVLQETSGQNGTMYRVALEFKNQELVPLTKNYDNFFPNKFKIINAINEFLSLPTDEYLLSLKNQFSRISKVIGVIMFFAIIIIVFASFKINLWQ